MSDDDVFRLIGLSALLAYLLTFVAPIGGERRASIQLGLAALIGVGCAVAIALYFLG